jgi:hypothetical protein
LFFIKLNIFLSFCFIINTLIDIRKGEWIEFKIKNPT